VCREVRSYQGKKVHLISHHSPGICKIPPECSSWLVQSTASLQRFALGSDADASLLPLVISASAVVAVP